MNTEVSCCHTVRLTACITTCELDLCLLWKLAVLIQILIERRMKNGRVFLYLYCVYSISKVRLILSVRVCITTMVYEVCSNSIRIGIVVVVHWVGCVCNQS